MLSVFNALQYLASKIFGSRRISATLNSLYGIPNAEGFLCVPSDQYKEKFTYQGPKPIVNLSCVSVADTFWREFEITPEFMKKPAYLVFDHYDAMIPSQLFEYYGVGTVEEAKALIKGKSEDELGELLRGRWVRKLCSLFHK